MGQIQSARIYQTVDGQNILFWHSVWRNMEEEAFAPDRRALETGTVDLVDGTMDTNNISFVGESVRLNGFKTVPNRTEASAPVRFVKMKVER